MKIQKIELKDSVIREVNGQFEQIFINEKTYPAFLTNYSLKKGREMGLLKSSLVDELFKWGNAEGVSLSERFEEIKMLTVIFVAFIGANPKTELSFDEFLEKYHNDIEDTMELYSDLVDGLVDSSKNKFTEGLAQSTEKPTGKK